MEEEKTWTEVINEGQYKEESSQDQSVDVTLDSVRGESVRGESQDAIESPLDSQEPNVQEEFAELSQEEEKKEEDVMGQIIESLEALNKKFDRKIAVDEHKDQLFDNMHAELTDYRNGIIDKPVEQVSLDIIRIIDGLKRSIAKYESMEPTEENFQKVLRILEGVIEDQEDLLYRQGIEPYSVEGNLVDVHRQKTIGSVATEDESLHNTVAERSVCGYEKYGKVIRPERIKIFKYVTVDEQ